MVQFYAILGAHIFYHAKFAGLNLHLRNGYMCEHYQLSTCHGALQCQQLNTQAAGALEFLKSYLRKFLSDRPFCHGLNPF